MGEQSDTPRTEMAEGQGLNPYFEGRFDGESDELRSLRLMLVKGRDEAWAEVEGLRSALLTLANAADDVGVQFFDMEDPPISVAQMQSATLAARAAAEIGRQMEGMT